jgi:hypothetical protein
LLAGGCERHRSAITVEYPRFQLSLERLDLPAQRRLGDVQLLGGTPEMKRFGNGDERPDLAQVKVSADVGTVSLQPKSALDKADLKAHSGYTIYRLRSK